MSKLHINLSAPEKEISPMLYGIFFEDINRGADGGLYAELIANNSFEYFFSEDGRDMHLADWETVGQASVSAETEGPLNEINPYYVRITSKGEGGIQNLGFGEDGFGIREGSTFRLSFFGRAERNTLISFRITADGRCFSEGSVFVDGNNWQKYELTLSTEATRMHARLEVLLPFGGNVDLDCISLFPAATYKCRKNGLRRDIMKLIRDIRPKFVRFPGGCVVEGRSFDTMYNWKDTIGPVEKRRVNRNRWQLEEYQLKKGISRDYFQSYGLGFYEYFVMCEDIGAEPVPVMNCGMTCQWHEGLCVPVEELEPWIQDVLDLIEFANGDEDSEWGSVRAKQGHKDPFDLKYIAIGNEQWGERYFERYEKFYDAINEKHPEIKLITSAGWNSEGEDFDKAVEWMKKNKEKAFAVDEHFYKPPEWFLSNTNRYDNYDRSLPKVFAGEYACHSDADTPKRRNNWGTALCEAAFMTGMERNADHVWMSCYAPLLGKTGFEQWRPDLIWFDNLGAYGTPSYYVQKLFSRSYGSSLIETNCDDKDIHISATTDGSEMYLKIVNTSAEKKELMIDSGADELYDDNAEAAVITAEPEDENSHMYPEKVAPVYVSVRVANGDIINVPGKTVMVITIR
jgi:alpha-L-arabinofuranosidase